RRRPRRTEHGGGGRWRRCGYAGGGLRAVPHPERLPHALAARPRRYQQRLSTLRLRPACGADGSAAVAGQPVRELMDVVSLSAADQRLLTARFAEHDNSHRRMRDALADAGATDAVARLEALRRVEYHFNLDLGLICHRHARRGAPDTHPLERALIG